MTSLICGFVKPIEDLAFHCMDEDRYVDKFEHYSCVWHFGFFIKQHDIWIRLNSYRDNSDIEIRKPTGEYVGIDCLIDGEKRDSVRGAQYTVFAKKHKNQFEYYGVSHKSAPGIVVPIEFKHPGIAFGKQWMLESSSRLQFSSQPVNAKDVLGIF